MQRKLSKRIKGSKNRNKQRIKVAKQHQKIANQRKDFQHKLSRKIVDDNQVSIIFVEDLNVRGMLKNHKLAKHIASVAWGQFLRFVEYKAKRVGKFFGKIGYFEPSSKMCHVCGHINHDLDLKDRTWTCPHCLSVLDRDINAAINIRNIGLYTAGITEIHACGEVTSTVELSVLQQAACVYYEVETKKVKPTQTCSRCGHQKPKTLDDRIHICEKCEFTMERDENSVWVMFKDFESKGLAPRRVAQGCVTTKRETLSIDTNAV